MKTQALDDLCADLYRDRTALVELNPSLSERAVVFWFLYGSLVSLLDVPSDFAPQVPENLAHEPFYAGVVSLLGNYAPDGLEWRGTIEQLAQRLILPDEGQAVRENEQARQPIDQKSDG